MMILGQSKAHAEYFNILLDPQINVMHCTIIVHDYDSTTIIVRAQRHDHMLSSDRWREQFRSGMIQYTVYSIQ